MRLWPKRQKSDAKDSPRTRTIYANGKPKREYGNNRVSTAQYSLLSSPLLVLFQFRKFSNIFFLFVVMVNFIPGVSVFSPFSILAPLIFVVGVGVLRELLEDLSRRRADRRANRQLARVYRSGRERVVPWAKLVAGDIVALDKGDTVPADLIILHTTDPDSLCYVQTANLDGETALKPRFAVGSTASLPESVVPSWRGGIEVNEPIRGLGVLDGRVLPEPALPPPVAHGPLTLDIPVAAVRPVPFKRQASVDLAPGPSLAPPVAHMTMTPHVRRGAGLLKQLMEAKDLDDDSDPETKPEPTPTPTGEPLSADNLLPRGTRMQNTERVLALVCYTGHQTKMYLNVTRPDIKLSKVDRRVNKLVLVSIVAFLILIAVSAVSSAATTHYMTDHWYLLLSSTSTTAALFRGAMSYFVLYAMIIPLSLFVSMEVARFVQARNMSRDKHMVEPPDPPARPDQADPRQCCVARTSALNEELGYIQHLFCDKTGTLTRNEMVLRRVLVGDTVFGVRADGRLESPDVGLAVYLQAARSALLHITLGNSVVPDGPVSRAPSPLDTEVDDDTADDDDLGEGAIHVMARGGVAAFQSVSPDEGAMVDAAHANGVTLTRRSKRAVAVHYYGRDRRFTVAAEIEFTSSRKRHTVLVSEVGRRGYTVITKGADSVILPRLVDAPPDTGAALDRFAREGLRTLAVGTKRIPSLIGIDWTRRWTAASAAVDGTKAARLDALAAELECGLTFSSVVGIEDRLAVDVVPTVRRLLIANIKLWVLTGDKLETAVNIGFSSGLLAVDAALHTITSADPDEVAPALAAIASARSDHPDASDRGRLKYPGLEETAPGQQQALVLGSEALDAALTQPDLLCAAAAACSVVLCCRAAPIQKAQVVNAVRRGPGRPVTAAVGDGANDVAMLRAAHVGLGIAGREGLQASRVADYSLPAFRHVSRLVLVHGRWNYRRLVSMVLYCMYKNMAAALLAFLFSFKSAFSATPLLTGTTIMLYNMVYTFLPPLVIGTLHTDAPARALEVYPFAYSPTQSQPLLAPRAVLAWAIETVWTVGAVFTIVSFAVSHGGVYSDGTVAGLAEMSMLITTALLLTVTLRLFIMCRPTAALVFAAAVSLVAFGIVTAYLNLFSKDPLEFGAAAILTTPAGMAIIVLAVTMASAPAVWLSALARHWKAPTAVVVTDAFNRAAKGEL